MGQKFLKDIPLSNEGGEGLICMYQILLMLHTKMETMFNMDAFKLYQHIHNEKYIILHTDDIKIKIANKKLTQNKTK